MGSGRVMGMENRMHHRSPRVSVARGIGFGYVFTTQAVRTDSTAGPRRASLTVWGRVRQPSPSVVIGGHWRLLPMTTDGDGCESGHAVRACVHRASLSRRESEGVDAPRRAARRVDFRYMS